MIYVQVSCSATWDQMVNNCCRYDTYDLKSIIELICQMLSWSLKDCTNHCMILHIGYKCKDSTSNWYYIIPALECCLKYHGWIRRIVTLNFLRSRMISIWYRSTSVMSLTDYIFTTLMSYNSIGHIYFFLHRRKYQCMTHSGQKRSDSRWWEYLENKSRLPILTVTGDLRLPITSWKSDSGCKIWTCMEAT